MDRHQDRIAFHSGVLSAGAEKGIMTPKQKAILDAAVEIAAVLQDLSHEDREQVITISGQLVLSEDRAKEGAGQMISNVVSIDRGGAILA